jgi:hypothetical protein
MNTTITLVSTIVGGAITFSLGQFILKACLEPALQLKQQIGKIAHDLDFYTNQMYGDAPQGKEARETFRKHACELRKTINTIIWYKFLENVISLPSSRDVLDASCQLIGHSNFPAKHDPAVDKTRDPEIKRLLKIKT